jgi:hypothetical protein
MKSISKQSKQQKTLVSSHDPILNATLHSGHQIKIDLREIVAIAVGVDSDTTNLYYSSGFYFSVTVCIDDVENRWTNVNARK